MEETPYPKKVRRLPTILSQEEVARLVDSAPTPFYRILVMTLYATGARCAEVARLQVGDIDSQRMVVHIRGGKGREDRDVMLSPVLLQALRQHWSRLKPKVWLFPGGRGHTATQPIRNKTVWHACYSAAQRSGLKKNVHPHTPLFRHPSPRGRYGPAHHPALVRSPGSERDQPLRTPFPSLPERYRQSSGRAGLVGPGEEKRTTCGRLDDF
jgi:site-specific recombinase XerD